MNHAENIDTKNSILTFLIIRYNFNNIDKKKKKPISQRPARRKIFFRRFGEIPRLPPWGPCPYITSPLQLECERVRLLHNQNQSSILCSSKYVHTNRRRIGFLRHGKSRHHHRHLQVPSADSLPPPEKPQRSDKTQFLPPDFPSILLLDF